MASNSRLSGTPPVAERARSEVPTTQAGPSGSAHPRQVRQAIEIPLLPRDRASQELRNPRSGQIANMRRHAAHDSIPALTIDETWDFAAALPALLNDTSGRPDDVLAGGRNGVSGHDELRWLPAGTTTPEQRQAAIRTLERLVSSLAGKRPLGPPGSGALNCMLHIGHRVLDGLPDDLTRDHLQATACDLAAELRDAAHAGLLSTRIDTLITPRPPSNLLAEWIDKLDHSISNPDVSKHVAATLKDLSRSARRQWLAYRMRPESELMPFLLEASSCCREAGAISMADLASHLHDELQARQTMKSRLEADPDFKHGALMRPAEFANEMGRVFDSAFAGHLYMNMPQVAIDEIDRWSQGLAAFMTDLSRNHPEEAACAVEEAFAHIDDSSRIWHPGPEWFDDCRRQASVDPVGSILAALRSPKSTMVDCSALIDLHIAIGNGLDRAKSELGHHSWTSTRTDRVMRKAVVGARDRVDWRLGEPSAKRTADATASRTPSYLYFPDVVGAGINQPPAAPMQRAVNPFPARANGQSAAAGQHPRLVDPTPQNLAVLDSGEVYAAGESGMLLTLALGMADFNRAWGADIDLSRAALVAWAALEVGGAHAIPELMRTTNRLKPFVDLGLTGPHQDPATYRPDLSDLVRHAPPGTSEVIQTALDVGFDAMIDYRRHRWADQARWLETSR